MYPVACVQAETDHPCSKPCLLCAASSPFPALENRVLQEGDAVPPGRSGQHHFPTSLKKDVWPQSGHPGEIAVMRIFAAPLPV